MDEKISLLTKEIYQAPISPQGWQPVLKQLKTLLKAEHAFLYRADLCSGKNESLEGREVVDPAFIELYDQHYSKINPILFIPNEDVFIPGHVGTHEDLIEDQVFMKTAFYQDFFGKFDLLHGLGCTISRESQKITVAHFARPPQNQAFSDEEKAILHHLMPHFQQALLLEQHIAQQRTHTLLQQSALDLVPIGLALVDQGLNMLVSNRHFEELASNHPEIQFKGHKLRLLHPALNKVLKEKVDKAITKTGKLELPTVINPTGCTKQAPFRLFIYPVDYLPFHTAKAQQVACIFLIDEDQDQGYDTEIIRMLFDLTATEAEVAQQLGIGRSPKEIADLLSVSVFTIRAHMRNVYTKMNVNRQSEVVKKLATWIPRLAV